MGSRASVDTAYMYYSSIVYLVGNPAATARVAFEEVADIALNGNCLLLLGLEVVDTQEPVWHSLAALQLALLEGEQTDATRGCYYPNSNRRYSRGLLRAYQEQSCIT